MDIQLTSKTQEQMTDQLEDETLRKTLSDMKENEIFYGVSVTEMSHSTVNFNLSNIEKPNDVSTVSVGVGNDITSRLSSIHQETSSMLKEECKYVGDIYGEKKHGNGIFSWPNGHTYTGSFFADKRHGFGILNIPDISQFKGLYCRDERFGPGILTYEKPQSADVGLWLSDNLIRLLNSHPKLRLDIHIKDKKISNSSLLAIPSWYSPEELLTTSSSFDTLFKKKSSAFICHSTQNENSFLTQYINEHVDRVKEIMHDKTKQIDAYLSSIYEENTEQTIKEKILNERQPDILPPNETYEQQQLYYYANKFWPLRQRAPFPIDDIISNTRSSFPNPGPLENSSLYLLELSYNGKDKEVRDILIQRLAYVDVCDSHGLTALHFATYNVHVNVINVLLDFGANVNQLSDDSLTPLSIAFLLYYGNNPQETTNTALEHQDPIISNPRTLVPTESNSSMTSKQQLKSPNSLINIANSSILTDENKLPLSIDSMTMSDVESTNNYGFQLTNNLSSRIRDEQFRKSVHSVILLLLRRGADPTMSDWPLPVLAFAVRAGDKQMVESLLKKKANVNCRLASDRHANLTPLHIACGCTSRNTNDIVRLLLEYGADANPESLAGNREYLSLTDPNVFDINKSTNFQQSGRTPLHIACARKENADTVELVRILLEHKANPNAVCNGQTPLTLAIALGNESIVDLLLNHKTTDPSTRLGFGNGNALCAVLSTFNEAHWSYAKRVEWAERIIAKNPRVLYPVRFGPKNSLGSIVDYMYYMFAADTRISQSPYHSLTNPERVVFGERKDLLAYMAKRLREEVSRYDDFLRLPTPALDDNTHAPSPTNLFSQRSISQALTRTPENFADGSCRITGEFRFCATCGRSTGVRLTLCKRCQKVSFCSKACKIAGWNEFHRYECHQVVTPTEKPPESVTSKSKNFTSLDRPLFKNSVLTTKTPARTNTNNRLPPLPVSKLLRQKRLKKCGKSNNSTKLSSKSVVPDDSHLSWNGMYNAPENYSYN